MKIYALTTGAVRVKHSFLVPSPGWRRQLDLFTPGKFSDPLPIHCWAIEHRGVLRLVDAGETAAARNVPFAQPEVAREQELPGAIAAAGLSPDDVAEVVITHAHGDHIDGLVHVRGRILINQTELRFLRSPMPQMMRRLLRQPLPRGFAPEPFVFDGGPFGAFPRSRALSEDGRIVVVDTPGHTPGHVSVICVQDDGQHVMIAGDATDTLESCTPAAPTLSHATRKSTSRRWKPFLPTAHNTRRSTYPPTTRNQLPGSQQQPRSGRATARSPGIPHHSSQLLIECYSKRGELSAR